MARLVSAKLVERLGQQVVVDNRGGAGGTIGGEVVAKSAPDGYTIMVAGAAIATSVSLYEKVAFDPLRDLRAVTLLAHEPSILAVHPSLPVKSVQELIALAEKAPGKINYAGSPGSTLQLGRELLKTMTHINLVHVPYKGTGPAVIAAIAGEAPVIMAPVLSVRQHVNSGRLRGLAATSISRIGVLPDLPTVAESGVTGFEAGQWYGVLVPAGTPDRIVTRLNKEFVTIMRSAEMSGRLLSEGSIPVGSTPEEFARFFKEDIAKWARVIKLSGVKAE